ncbi:MAG: hypothetical protein EPN69_06415 [Rhodanobacter sp.]|nr:MAG: hypothetical protein EPN69_06415 [Rhodanobacter sp.]TAM07275.1 MAG: hypothetical protein EPN71_00255 [Rhodanobacter sp.]TAM42716.1 MAG: hypothetical protein EPN58_01945 [Rhodanobacter sp.]TAN26874.1 MAG: hypothetical protein EPN32_05670 [Rhodanobacter sp.]
MNDSPKSPTTKHEGARGRLVGGDVLDVVQVGTGDLSDWMELMEAVEALCPVWPVVEVQRVGAGKLKL